MTIITLADLHGELGPLACSGGELAAAEVVLLAGDLTHFGDAAAAAQVLEQVRQHNAQVLAVPGNCDFPQVGAYLEAEGASLEGRHVVLGGVAFLGVGGSLPCPGRTPGEITEQDFAARLEQAARDLPPGLPLVLLCHQPPLGTTLDRTFGGRHVGSRAVRTFIEQRQPLLCLCGHIHEAAGVDRLGATLLANPGPARRGGYAWAQLDGAARLEVRQAG